MSFTEYDKILIKQMAVYSVPLIFLGLITAAMLIYSLKKLKGNEKKLFSLLFTLITAAIAAFLIWKLPNYIYDIKNKAYITYDGNVYIENDGTGDTVYLTDASKKLLAGYTYHVSGKFYGKVVYAERSGELVHMDITLKEAADSSPIPRY